MNTKIASPLGLVLLTALLPAAFGQATTRVMPATVPIPLPGARPMPPDVLRARSPYNLSMTGMWKFKLTHGQIIGGRFGPSDRQVYGIDASSYQSENPPTNAIDNTIGTRWCADGPTFPQWLSADLRRPMHVTGVTLNWERPHELYRCRIEGSMDGKSWKQLSDAKARSGISDGPVALTPSSVRFVRVAVLGSQGGWASLWEVKIHVLEGGQDVTWRPTINTSLARSADDFTKSNFNDSYWDSIPVPSNWEMLGYSLPTYDSVDDTVGLYRRWVQIPKSFAGRKIYWHFDGAMDGTEVFVNGQKAGYHESGFTGFDVDLTGLVKPGGSNLFALRVSKTTPSSDCETGDFQCLGGIYRDTSLIAVPQTHVHDITLRTTLDSEYRNANLSADVLVSGIPGHRVVLDGAVVSITGATLPVHLSGQATIGVHGSAIVSLRALVKSPKLWSAEKPNLYYLVAQLLQNGQTTERVEQRFGFRQVEIKHDVVLWNGKPIKCTGVCRHDYWASKGFALTDTEWNKDLTMMKAANINAIRTSHYNHAARFLELCEERGMYILDEVPFCWVNDKVSDPKFAPPLLARAAETVARDKNRPCVLAWSLGNENPIGPDTQQVRDLVEHLDPTRPAFASCGNPSDIKGQDFFDMHYPSPHDIDNYAEHNSNKAPAMLSEQPHTFYEKEAQQYDPGVSDLWSEVLIKTWAKLWNDPTILGSFIWEWQSQGIADKNKDRTRDFWYGSDHLRQENNKGIVDAFRNPKPELWIVKQVYTKVVIGSKTVTPAHAKCTIPITNRYSFTNLDELPCVWTALRGSQTISKGSVRIYAEPGRQVQASFPAPAGMTAMRLTFLRPDNTSAADALLDVAGSPKPVPPVRFASGGGALRVRLDRQTLTVKNSLQRLRFDEKSGSILDWRVAGRNVLTGGPVLNLGEAKEGNSTGYFSAAHPPIVNGVVVHTRSIDNGGVQVVVSGTVRRSVGDAPLGTIAYTYNVQTNAMMTVSWQLNWIANETHLWESGLKLSLPASDDRMSWWRTSYFTVYPTGHIGEPLGSCRANETSFRASKRNLHWMTVAGASGNGLELVASNTPLIARAVRDRNSTTLFASSNVAGLQGLSGSWVVDHDIIVKKGSSISGQFALRAY